MEKKYHIYLKEKCIDWNIPEEDFNKLWNNYLCLAEIHKDINKTDLSYEEVVFDKKEYSIQGI